MGWWGHNIMEGDTPLDCEGDIIDFLANPALVEKYRGGGDDQDDIYDAIQESGYAALKVDANVLNVFQAIADNKLCTYDGTIGMQVLGEMIMCSGGVFPDVVRGGCILAAQMELSIGDKSWNDEGTGRAQCLQSYIQRVNNYVDGTAYEPTSEGLFAKILA